VQTPGTAAHRDLWTTPALSGALGFVGYERQMARVHRPSSRALVDHALDATGARAAPAPSPTSGGDGLDRTGPALDDTTNFGSGDGVADTDVHVSLHDNESDYHFKASIGSTMNLPLKHMILFFNLLRQVVRLAQLANQLQLLFEPIDVGLLGNQDLGEQILGPVVA